MGSSFSIHILLAKYQRSSYWMGYELRAAANWAADGDAIKHIISALWNEKRCSMCMFANSLGQPYIIVNLFSRDQICWFPIVQVKNDFCISINLLLVKYHGSSYWSRFLARVTGCCELGSRWVHNKKTSSQHYEVKKDVVCVCLQIALDSRTSL